MAPNGSGGNKGGDEEGEWLRTYVHGDGEGGESEESKQEEVGVGRV